MVINKGENLWNFVQYQVYLTMNAMATTRANAFGSVVIAAVMSTPAFVLILFQTLRLIRAVTPPQKPLRKPINNGGCEMSMKNKIGNDDNLFWLLIALLVLVTILLITDTSFFQNALLILGQIGCPPGSDPMCL